MNKSIVISVIILFTAIITLSFTNQTNDTKTNTEVEGIQFFSGTWEEALKEAKKENKLIFLDAYAAWCGPCKALSKYVFTNSVVGTYFNENFISFKMDMEKHSNGPRLASKYNLKAYPSLFFINGNEKLIHSGLGYLKKNQLLDLGKAAQSTFTQN